MVFSPVPVYLDPPNWPQQQNPQEVVGGAGENSHLPPPLMPPPAPVGAGGEASIRPGSMAERARLAKIPQPETALKCPRCESTNTKFCYYNNYNLTQPRHFCKTCRRYWTRGGALRNVPVGGGCRRNKRSKGNSRSKSPMTSTDHQNSNNSTSTTSAITTSNTSCSTDVISHFPFFPPMHNLADFTNPDIGMSFGGIQSTIGNNSSVDMGTGPLNLSARFADQWKLHQFPFFGGFERAGTGIYQFEGDQATDQALSYGGSMNSDHVTSRTLEGGGSVVKLEENQHGSANLSRNFMSIPAGNDQYWSSATSNAWTDLSGSTSSAGHYIM